MEAAEAAGEVLEVEYSMAYVPSSPRVDRESLLEEAAAAREAEEEALEAKAEAEAKIAATEKMIANALEEVEEYKAMAEEAAEAATQAAAEAARLEAAAGRRLRRTHGRIRTTKKKPSGTTRSEIVWPETSTPS